MLSFFCPCPRGLEFVLFQELENLAYSNKQYNITSIKCMSSGVSFKGDMLSCYAVNLFSRIASRVLLHINSSPYRTEDDIYHFSKRQQWDAFFTARQTIRLDVNAHHCPLKSLNFVNLKVKDAICDYFRAKTGSRPSVDTENPQVKIMTFLDKTMCSLYIDTSGDALFKRGWRKDIGEAPVKENLAAGILYLTNWRPETTLFDPMCGSGTFLIEAIHMAVGIPPGANRNFGFEVLKVHQPSLWQGLKVFANQQRQKGLKTNITYVSGSDISEKMLATSRNNAERAGVSLSLELVDVRKVIKPSDSGILVANPPYGERISMRGVAPKSFIRGANNANANANAIIESNKEHEYSDNNLEDSQDRNITEVIPPISLEQKEFYSEWASNLKNNFNNWQVYILSADLDLPKHMRLKPKQKIPLFNGKLDCRLFVFDMVQGSMRKD
jgi:putative N6-adenine-specific DNA methylase